VVVTVPKDLGLLSDTIEPGLHESGSDLP
jgi:hypothetical protein